MWAEYWHCSMCIMLAPCTHCLLGLTEYTDYRVYGVQYPQYLCTVYIPTEDSSGHSAVVVMLGGGEGGISAARWSWNWFCPAAQGQIRYTTQANTETNTLHYRSKYTIGKISLAHLRCHLFILYEDTSLCFTWRDQSRRCLPLVSLNLQTNARL